MEVRMYQPRLVPDEPFYIKLARWLRAIRREVRNRWKWTGKV